MFWCNILLLFVCILTCPTGMRHTKTSKICIIIYPARQRLRSLLPLWKTRGKGTSTVMNVYTYMYVTAMICQFNFLKNSIWVIILSLNNC